MSNRVRDMINGLIEVPAVRDAPRERSYQQSLGELAKHASSLAQSDRFGFEVRFNRMRASQALIEEPPPAIYLLCQGINLPPVTLMMKQLRWDHGPFFNRPQGIDYGGEGLAIEFVLDVELTAKTFFESWINVIFDANNASLSFPELYMHEIRLYNLDMMDTPRHVVVLKDAFPRSLSMINFSQGGMNTAASFTVTFTYHHIETYTMPAAPLGEEDYRRGYRQLAEGEFPAPDGYDFSSTQSNRSKAARYLDRAISFFASLNPTVYNIYENTRRFSTIKV
jgi:hypothetical protein